MSFRTISISFAGLQSSQGLELCTKKVVDFNV